MDAYFDHESALVPVPWLLGAYWPRKSQKGKSRLLSSVGCDYPGYRRLRYVRYADDTLLGFAGTKAEAEEIKERLARSSCMTISSAPSGRVMETVADP
ncbi:hypothetical protein [Streptomyces sp. NPDC055287]